MSEEKLSATLDESFDSETPETEDTELIFQCPACGGDQLGYGTKVYQKAIIFADGEMDVYGGEDMDENETDFMCWHCDHVICVDGQPVRSLEEMIEWLKAHPAIVEEEEE